MTHDPLCPTHRSNSAWLIRPRDCDYCKVIAKVREDERDKDLDYRYIAAQAEAQGQRDMLAKCIEVAVAVLGGVPTSFWINRNSDEAQEHKRSMRAALEAALRALEEKP